MKRTLLFFCCCAMLTGDVLAQWRAQRSGTSSVSFRGLSVVSTRVAWASGTGGSFARTVDGGAHWRLGVVPGASALDFRDVDAFDDDTAYLLATAGRIYKTTDGGRRWRLQYINTTPGIFLDAMAFWDARRGVAFGDPLDGSFLILTTDDGGQTWRRVPPESIPPPLAQEAAFAASGTCIAVEGERNVWFATGGASVSRVYRSTDAGRTWSVAETPVRAGNASSGIFSIAFRNALEGVAVGGDYQQPNKGSERDVALTEDGGRTWTLGGVSQPPGVRYAVAYAPGARALVSVGPSGTGYSVDGGRTWTAFGSEGFNSVGFAGRTSGGGWAVGPDGRIARFTGRLTGTGRGGRR